MVAAGGAVLGSTGGQRDGGYGRVGGDRGLGGYKIYIAG